MLNKIKTFYDQLYFGFKMYGKNYYSDNFSKDYGIISLLICNTVILMPLIGYFLSIILPKYNLTNTFVYLIFVFIGLTLLFLHLIYFNNKRIKKILNKYDQLDGFEINKIKRMSGYFAIFSFILSLLITVTIIIIT